MSIQRETYTELMHSMIFAFASEQLTLAQLSSVLFACAQPDTTEETTDLTHDVRAGLTDWSEMNKGMLIAVEAVKLTFRCHNIHGPCKQDQHSVFMTRVIGSMDWVPEQVSSQHVFSDVILAATMKLNPGQGHGRAIRPRRGTYAELIGAFRDMFLEQPEQRVEKEVSEFRAELDKLFPSAPSTQHKKGGSDDSERPTT